MVDFNPGQMGLEFGGGAVIGALIGFTAKKVAKIIAILVGIELALFKFLETRGVLDVNWDMIYSTAGNTTEVATSARPPSWIMSLLSALPVSAGFAGGFLVGFKKG